MKEIYELVKSFPWYKKWLRIEYDNTTNQILTDLINEEKLHCELPDNVIMKNKSWFKKINPLTK